MLIKYKSLNEYKTIYIDVTTFVAYIYIGKLL